MKQNRPKIIGFSASLRNSRRSIENQDLVQDLKEISNKGDLIEYLKNQSKIRLDQFVESGRKEGLPFDEIYRNLKKKKGTQGLSNSEVALAASLWECHQSGCEIEHVTLSDYFLESKKKKNESLLIQKIREADGIILSTPVYFGDRSSLSQSFINFLNQLKDQIDYSKKVYAGISVGAKRNGGQETTLMYQLFDMTHLGFLGVGNDSETTSQYGGTGYAGDIGSMGDDQYGLDVSMGTGRRIAQVCQYLSYKTDKKIDKLKVQFWILQDKQNQVNKVVKELFETVNHLCDFSYIDLCNKEIVRCIACDICPTHISVDEEYRCIINSKKDDFEELHNHLLGSDVIIPVIFSSKNRENVISNYQRFIERTRYLRRGDYVFSDLIVKPLIIEEVYSEENMIIRSMTSFMRHHTILSKPIHVLKHKDELIGLDLIKKDIESNIVDFSELTAQRLLKQSKSNIESNYSPVGYILSAEKDKEDIKLNQRQEMINKRFLNLKKQIKSRLK